MSCLCKVKVNNTTSVTVTTNFSLSLKLVNNSKFLNWFSVQYAAKITSIENGNQ